MYDSPKAAHFTVLIDGVEPEFHTGLKYRWQVANFVREYGIENMICAEPHRLEAAIVAANFNLPVGVTVGLRGMQNA